MPAVARIESTLGFNDLEFTRGIERAEKRAATFGGRVEATFQGLFRRTPGRRAERAISNLLGDISTGNLSQGIAQFAGRLTGLGLAAGVGVGVAVELFSKLHESVVEVRQAHDELDKQMGRPLRLTSIEGLGKAIDNLREKQSTFTHGFTNILYDIAHQKGAGGLTDLGKASLGEEREISEAIGKRQAAEKLRGRKELVQANVLSGLESDPQRKALAELRFKFEERRNALEASPDKGTRDRLKALDVEQDAAERNFRLHKADGNARLDVEEKIAKLQRLPISQEHRKSLQLGEEIKGLDAQIAGEKNPNTQRELRLQKFKKETEFRGLNADPNKQNESPFAYGTIARRDFENESGFGSLAQRNKDMNDPSVWGSLGYNAMQRGELPQTKEQGNDVVKAVNDLINLTREIYQGK